MEEYIKEKYFEYIPNADEEKGDNTLSGMGGFTCNINFINLFFNIIYWGKFPKTEITFLYSKYYY